MAIYFFDVDDNGSLYPDDQGTDCPNFAHVKKEAISALVDMIKETLPDGDHHRLAIKVRDNDGTLILQAALNFDVEEERLAPESSFPPDGPSESTR